MADCETPFSEFRSSGSASRRHFYFISKEAAVVLAQGI
jgi:hypothetical protein